VSYARATLAAKQRHGARGQPNHPGAAPKPKTPWRVMCEFCLVWFPGDEFAGHKGRCPKTPRRR
jgi:hypothetical protein